MSYIKYIFAIPMTCFTGIGILNYQHLFTSGFNNMLPSTSIMTHNSLPNNSLSSKITTNQSVQKKSDDLSKKPTLTQLKYFWGY